MKQHGEAYDRRSEGDQNSCRRNDGHFVVDAPRVSAGPWQEGRWVCRPSGRKPPEVDKRPTRLRWIGYRRPTRNTIPGASPARPNPRSPDRKRTKVVAAVAVLPRWARRVSPTRLFRGGNS